MPDDMERIPKEIFDEAGLKLDDRLLNFLVAAPLRPQIKGPWVQAASAALSSRLLEKTLRTHATSPTQLAQASQSHAAIITRATWALFLTSAVVAVATIALILK